MYALLFILVILIIVTTIIINYMCAAGRFFVCDVFSSNSFFQFFTYYYIYIIYISSIASVVCRIILDFKFPFFF